MTIDPSIFKDYDIRATVPDQLDEKGMYQLGLAINKFSSPSKVAIGRDMRLTSDLFHSQLEKAFTDSGVDVVDLGLVTTDMTYFASATKDYDITLMITASHNPPEWNGLKITKKGAIAVSGNSGIYDIRDLALEKIKPTEGEKGSVSSYDIYDEWIKHALNFVDINKIKPLNVVFDAGNGMGGVIMKKVEKLLPIKIEPMFFEPDGNFPNHLAYPLQEENLEMLKDKIKNGDYDLGVASDGDADRMFLVDENGSFVSGTEMTAMVAEFLLQRGGADKVIYNAICGRIVPEVVEKYGGTPIRWRVGHSLLKEKMREEDAMFAGEHSGHFFFRDNYTADSGLIVLLLALQAISESGQPLSEFLKQYRKYPSSGEINFRVEKKEETMKEIERTYGEEADSVDWLDGVTVWFSDWWFNVRPSNTQPLLRLNIEINDTNNLTVEDKVKELVSFIENQGGQRVQE